MPEYGRIAFEAFRKASIDSSSSLSEYLQTWDELDGIIREWWNAAAKAVREPVQSNANTVRVRIAVAVDRYGNWNSFGHCAADDEMDHAVDGVSAGEDRYWIEVDLPVPEEKVITDVRVTSDGEG